ncbi:HU family DNA-binding protein [Streptomyces sp. NPDC014748]|uniref:HU family DNA-binding protein n=1 Tax=Streptomyces sp. NPDC014748 TaxID=3364905 RepID=UPI0036FD3F75
MKKTKRRPTPITGRLTTTKLIDVVAADLDADPKQVRDTVMATFDAIARATAGGHDVAITNFGTWVSYRVKRHKARDPRTGESLVVAAHQKVRFRVSDSLAAAVRRRDRKATIRKAPKGSLTTTAPE